MPNELAGGKKTHLEKLVRHIILFGFGRRSDGPREKYVWS